MKSFREFISEANYGALQTDKRIVELRDKLIKKLVDKWMREHRTDVDVTGLTRVDDAYKDDYETKLKIVKDMPSDEIPKDLIFFSGMTAQRPWRNTENTIVIVIRADVDYTEAIRRIDEIKPLLSHEIKHAMDNNDEKYGRNNMASYIMHNGENYKQYVNQVQEISNFVITVVEDIGVIRKRNPDITFADALAQSFWWNHLLDSAIYKQSDINKFKSKLAAYWNAGKTDVKENIKSLQLQLMLLLYQWHKDGDMKKMKAAGLATVDTLMKNIGRMDVTKLKDSISHFQKLMTDRNSK